jgi:hypothetical protein
MKDSMMANDTVKKLAALATGIGIGPLSLRLLVAIGFPATGQTHDSVVPLAVWLTFSSIAQVCSVGLVVGGSVVWLGANLARWGRVQQCGVVHEPDHEEAEASA